MPTILVADDNSNIQKMVSLVFKEKGIRVVAVGNGEAACRKVPEVHPDLVLADVFMPVRNGYEVCEFVKQDPQFAETPVILLVGAFDPLDEKEAQRVGANGVLKKPFVPPEPLVDLVSSLLKVQPAVEQAAAPVETAPMPAPAPVAPPAPAREVTSVAVLSDEGDADEIAPTFGEPVATPAAKASEAEEIDDDSDPTSEWTRRRAAMDYEIDAAESANMVEKLSAGNTSEEAGILPSNKHMPFGGANVSEITVEADPSPHTPSSGSMVTGAAAEASTETPEQEIVLESSPVVSEKWETTSSQAEVEGSSIEEFNAPSPVAEETPSQETEPAPAYGGLVLESSELTSDPIQETPSAAWALPQTPQSDETISVEADDVAPAEAQATSSYSETAVVWQDTVKQIVEPPVVPVTNHTALEDADVSATHSHALDAAATDLVSAAPVEQATVDDVVARVIAKLEPQLHQALANGVLRPLVEEVLNQQRREKK